MPNHEVTITPISGQDGISRYQITIVGDGALTTHGLYETLESALDSFEPSLSARVRSHIVEGVRGEGKGTPMEPLWNRFFVAFGSMLKNAKTRPDLFLLLSLLLVILVYPALDHGDFRRLILVAVLFVPVILSTVGH